MNVYFGDYNNSINDSHDICIDYTVTIKKGNLLICLLVTKNLCSQKHGGVIKSLALLNEHGVARPIPNEFGEFRYGDYLAFHENEVITTIKHQ